MRKKMLLKKGTALLSAMVMTASLAACGGVKDTVDSQGSQADSQQAAESSKADGKAEEAGFSYPMEGGGALSYWMELNSNVASNYTSVGETPFARALQEKTGITIEFQHPAVGQTQEAFNLLLANADLPDIIEYSWINYSGGPEKAIDDEVIISLNEIMDEYCPNLKAFLEANPEVDKMVKTDDGLYYCFPFIRGEAKLMTSVGLMLRQDWLEELNLEVPETIDEWHDVLTAFKEEKGAAAPFTYLYGSGYLTDNNPFAFAYGAPRSFYVGDDGRVHYGAIDDGYREYLQTMKQWMSEGLIDVDLATLTGDQVTAKITNGSAGASFGYCGSGMGVWTNSGQSTDPAYALISAPYPTVNKGDTPEFGQKDNDYVITGAAAISSSCENIEAAARLLDYAYSEEGHLLYNFGIEGESYEMTDGKAIFTEKVMNNPDLSLAQSLSGYIRATYNGPFVQDGNYIDQYYALDSQKDAVIIWSSTNAKAHIVPPITATVEESSELSQLMNEINTYRDENTLKFMLGTRSLDEWDAYVNEIKDMNIERALEIQNAALDRYNAR